MSKLSRAQVVAEFKLNILPDIIKEVGDDFIVIEHCWDVNLDSLKNESRITQKQRLKWKLKEKELK